MLNWWDIIHIDGYADLNTKLSKVVAAAGPDKCIELLSPVLGPAARAETLNMLDAMTVLRMINVITGMMRMPVTKDMLMDLNAELNKIKL